MYVVWYGMNGSLGTTEGITSEKSFVMTGAFVGKNSISSIGMVVMEREQFVSRRASF